VATAAAAQTAMLRHAHSPARKGVVPFIGDAPPQEARRRAVAVVIALCSAAVGGAIVLKTLLLLLYGRPTRDD
jgi:hypothetical protein